jgi:hypothetical protein
MPQILVIADSSDGSDRTVVYRERLAPSDFDSAMFAGQLAERVGWAVSDADLIEEPAPRPAPVSASRLQGVRPSAV